MMKWKGLATSWVDLFFE